MSCRDCGTSVERRFRLGKAPLYCRPCKRRRKNEYAKGYNARYRHPKPARRRDQSNACHRSRRHRDRQACLDHYGGRCACCGEAHYEFLAIDHIAGGGRRHRASLNTSIETWLVNNRFPAGFRLLCHNCNMALGFYGRCPHGMVRDAAAARVEQQAPLFEAPA